MTIRVVPDLRGLWSCAVIGKPQWWSKIVGGFVLTCLVNSWCLGIAAPVIPLYLFFTGYKMLGFLLFLLLAYPYVLKVQPWPLAARFWLLGAHWFGGCSMSFEERDPNDLSNPTMSLYFPHGVFTLGLILNSGIRMAATGTNARDWHSYCGKTGPFPFIGLAAAKLVNAPIFGHMVAKWTGCIESSSRDTLVRKMQRGESFGLTPGGFLEASLFEYGKDRIVVTSRKGFIKYALQYGYNVVPAYSFGECHTYYNVRGFTAFRKWLADRDMPGIFIRGFALLPWLPFTTPWGIHTIHGTGRQFPKIEAPTKEDIDHYHNLLLKDVRSLFDRHKWRFGQQGVELEILEID